jgi:hypothetical protein
MRGIRNSSAESGNAMRMGIIEQDAMVGLWNQTAGSTPGLFTLPPVRRRECRAGNSGHLGFAAELFDDACCRIHAGNFGYSEMKVKLDFG